jgi:hypothetical protein
MIFADYNPGSLTMFGILALSAVMSVLCVVCGGMAYLAKELAFCRRFLLAAGIFFASGVALSIVGKLLGKKYGFP